MATIKHTPCNINMCRRNSDTYQPLYATSQIDYSGANLFRCRGDNRCHSKIINCPLNVEYDCIAYCTGSNTCAAMTINGPIYVDCYIFCSDSQSCLHLTIKRPTNHALHVYLV